MKNLSFLVLLSLILMVSCAKEVASEQAGNEAKAAAFLQGKSPNKSKSQLYFVKRNIEAKYRSPEPVMKYGSLSSQYRGSDNWKPVHEGFSEAIQAWLSDEETKEDPGILSGIELYSYIFLRNYLFEANPSPKLAEATSFYLKTLMQFPEASEWGILANALLLSKDVLNIEEYDTYASHIRQNAENILANGPDQSYSLSIKEVQLKAAKEAIELLGNSQ